MAASLLATEARLALPRHPLSQQVAIHASSRARLLDWVQHLCSEFLLKRRTFAGSASLVDAFLASPAGEDFPRATLPLLCAAAVMIASKNECVYPPYAADIASYSEGTLLVPDILTAELQLAQALGWDTARTTVVEWVSLLVSAVGGVAAAASATSP